MTTHPPGHPSGPTGPGRLPRLGEVIRDAERLLRQAADVLARDVDPASEPDVLAWPLMSQEIRAHRLLIAHVTTHVEAALCGLGKVAALPMPPAGSAVDVKAHAALLDVDEFAKNVSAALERQAAAQRRLT